MKDDKKMNAGQELSISREKVFVTCGWQIKYYDDDAMEIKSGTPRERIYLDSKGLAFLAAVIKEVKP